MCALPRVRVYRCLGWRLCVPLWGHGDWFAYLHICVCGEGGGGKGYSPVALHLPQSVRVHGGVASRESIFPAA